jgi:hypothetical protein
MLTHVRDRVVGDAWVVPAGRIQSLFDLQLGMVTAFWLRKRGKLALGKALTSFVGLGREPMCGIEQSGRGALCQVIGHHRPKLARAGAAKGAIPENEHGCARGDAVVSDRPRLESSFLALCGIHGRTRAGAWMPRRPWARNRLLPLRFLRGRPLCRLRRTGIPQTLILVRHRQAPLVPSS